MNNITLSEIASPHDYFGSLKIRRERAFNFFARATTRVEGEKCIFVADPKYIKLLDDTVAMIITTKEIEPLVPENIGVCVTENPRGLYFELMSEYERNHPATVSETVIGKNCCISSKACIAEHNVIIGSNVHIDDYVTIHPNTIIHDDTTIQRNANIGEQDLNVYTFNGKNKQVYHGGRTEIGTNVLISTGVVVGQALYSYGVTSIGSESYIGAFASIGHNSTIGSNCEICGNSMLGGYCKIGSDSKLFMSVTVGNGLEIGSRVRVNMGSVVVRNIEDGVTVFGNPAKRVVTPK